MLRHCRAKWPGRESTEGDCNQGFSWRLQTRGYRVTTAAIEIQWGAEGFINQARRLI